MAGAADKAYEVIRSALLRGELTDGARLKEKDLAESIGVSRTPVREALRRLNAEGLIEFTSNHRAAVALWSGENVDDLFSLRARLESFAAKLASERITADKIAELEGLAESMEQAARANRVSFDRISQLNGQFHKIILEASGSKRLRALMAGLIELPIILRTYHHYTPDELSRSFGHHREMISAFQAHDGEWARCVMTSHILGARASYMRAANIIAPQANTRTKTGRRKK